MATGNSEFTRSPMYPTIDDSNVSSTLQNPPSSATQPNLYPTIDKNDLDGKLFPPNQSTSDENTSNCPSAPPECIEETLLTIRGAIVHLIDKQYSVELATGDLLILRLRQGDNTLAIFARVDDEIQWPLTKDLAAVKLDNSHYFFSFPSPKEADSDSSSDSSSSSDEENENKHKKKANKSENDALEVLNYGLFIASKGQESLLKDLDRILENSSSFSIHTLEGKVVAELMGNMAKEVSPEDLNIEENKEMLEGNCAAYWTTLAPNVEEYSGIAAKLVAMGSGQLIKGILWCGDVAVDRLKWGNDFLKKRMASGSNAEVSPQTLKRIKRVKKITRMTENVANGVLTGVIKVSGYFTGSVANSKVGKKFFSLLPGEVVLASLDGFSKICDAVEVAGKNVMSTSNTVTTGLVSHRYGEEAAKATNEGLDAAGHAIGTAWAAFKIRKAFNPKSVLKPGYLTKAAAEAAESAKKKSDKKKSKSSK